MWDEKEIKDLMWAYGAAFAKEGMKAGVLAVADKALEMLLARASGQVARDVRTLQMAWWSDCEEECEGEKHTDTCEAWGYEQALSRLAALAQEAETLRAKVAELESGEARQREAKYESYREAHGLEQQFTALRAEVERLAHEEERLQAESKEAWSLKRHWHERARAAESRLAAIRERGANVAMLAMQVEAGWAGVSSWGPSVHQDVRNANALPYLHYAAQKAARWILEGDAPQEMKAHDIYACHVENCPGCERVIATQDAAQPTRSPCSPTCTHDEAGNPDHPGRVKELSAEVMAMSGGVPRQARLRALSEKILQGPDVVDGGPGARGPWRRVAESARRAADAYADGAEAMRAACLDAALGWAQRELGLRAPGLKAAIEGAAP